MPFRHYRVLAEKLADAVEAGEVKAATRDEILSGMDYVRDGAKPEVKAAWACEMMDRMDRLLEEPTRRRVREKCSCVFSNENSIYAKTFRRLRKQYPSNEEYLDQVVAYLNGTEPLLRCGDVERRGSELHSLIARKTCDCSAVGKGLTRPVSRTWCECCKGSLLSVYRYVFPEKDCRMEILRTVASGADECCFVTRYS